jgi:hypothetical protein
MLREVMMLQTTGDFNEKSDQPKVSERREISVFNGMIEESIGST